MVHIFAHSLGTIPAFNALQETEWALPNYLTEAEWQALPGRFKTQEPFTPPCARPTTERMMPRRPPWLEPTDGVDRRRLFERFAGFVTYGSPLDKFAALWPRVVCLNRQAAVFPPRSEWINLHDPTDPVAARLDAFAPPQNREDPDVGDRMALEPRNFACRASAIFGLSHIRYFRPRPNGPRTMASALAGALVSSGRIPLSKAAKRASIGGAEAWLRMAAAIVQVAALGLLLTLAGSLLLTGIAEILPFGLGDRIERAIDARVGRLPDWLPRPDWPGGADWEHVYAAGALILALAVGAIIIAGIARVAADIVRIARERKAKR